MSHPVGFRVYRTSIQTHRRSVAVYDGEGRWVASWDRKHAIDFAERTLEFLYRRLKAGE